MTYQELYLSLREEFNENANVFLKLDQELNEVNGFIDLFDIEKWKIAKEKWQVASNKYNTFLDFVREHRINPNDEFGI